jgi:anti-anti-sigma factor
MFLAVYAARPGWWAIECHGLLATMPYFASGRIPRIRSLRTLPQDRRSAPCGLGGLLALAVFRIRLAGVFIPGRDGGELWQHQSTHRSRDGRQRSLRIRVIRRAGARSYRRDMTSESTGSPEPASLDVSIGPVVTISGEIDIQSGPQLRDQLLGIMRRRGAQLALDLTGVTFIDCAGINVLLSVHRRAQLEGGRLRVVRASPRVRRVLALTRLDRLLMPTARPYMTAS